MKQTRDHQLDNRVDIPMEDCNVSSWQGLHELLMLRYEKPEGRGGMPQYGPEKQDFELNALG